MRPILLIAAVLSLAACNEQESAPQPANEAAAAPEAALTQTPELSGDWQVAAIDGKPPAEAMSASFSGGKASLSAGCVRRGWTYTQKRNVVSFAANPAASSNCEGRGASAEQATASDALQNASIVIFSKDGSEADLSGTGGNLKLRRR